MFLGRFWAASEDVLLLRVVVRVTGSWIIVLRICELRAPLTTGF